MTPNTSAPVARHLLFFLSTAAFSAKIARRHRAAFALALTLRWCRGLLSRAPMTVRMFMMLRTYAVVQVSVCVCECSLHKCMGEWDDLARVGGPLAGSCVGVSVWIVLVSP